MTTTIDVDKKSPALVTGATGYVAGVLIKELLSLGITVHGTVRDPTKTDRFEHLTKLADNSPGSIKFFHGDLMEDGSYADAMKGCSVVFHTASPFVLDVKDPHMELVVPAVQGTRNVLNEATKSQTVKKVVMTSSTTAIHTDASDTYRVQDNILNEDVWNTTASLDYQPYNLSKTKAEQAAWICAGSQTQWKLVVINPSFVMGPGTKYHPSSESFSFVKAFFGGLMGSGCPNFGIGFVDVRDVAHAHVVAAYSDKAQGRNICNAHNSCVMGMTEAVREKFGKAYKLPPRSIPRLLLWLLSPFLPLSGRYIWNNCDVAVNLDNTKIRTEMGIHFRPLKETMEDMFQQMIDGGAFEEGKAKQD